MRYTPCVASLLLFAAAERVGVTSLIDGVELPPISYLPVTNFETKGKATASDPCSKRSEHTHCGYRLFCDENSTCAVSYTSRSNAETSACPSATASSYAVLPSCVASGRWKDAHMANEAINHTKPGICCEEPVLPTIWRQLEAAPIPCSRSKRGGPRAQARPQFCRNYPDNIGNNSRTAKAKIRVMIIDGGEHRKVVGMCAHAL